MKKPLTPAQKQAILEKQRQYLASLSPVQLFIHKGKLRLALVSIKVKKFRIRVKLFLLKKGWMKP